MYFDETKSLKRELLKKANFLVGEAGLGTLDKT